MTRMRGTVVAGAALLLAAATWAQAEPFREVKYLGGLPGVSRTVGTLEVRGAELRFADRKGRVLFSRLLVPASAWVGQEKVTSDGCVARNLALLPVLFPLAASSGGNPWLGGCGRTRSVVELRIGEGDDAVVAAAAGAERAGPRPRGRPQCGRRDGASDARRPRSRPGVGRAGRCRLSNRPSLSA